ncbi:unnamed protein product [Vitrella brassicaformis CCMP3155]|uniref:Uncharacterized protein n=1 Tax=Vitrella brassicaformis (strain CCMP3155) TaxID=1169540 RepID=A0A0G4FAC6_VITBC|nr:unnamed protein product [Vitrella brassicaformis CCMP3155]|eukprot:CEM09886.1 unnamed protein product [Vitrella brassicaformis CCMP3155]
MHASSQHGGWGRLLLCTYPDQAPCWDETSHSIPSPLNCRSIQFVRENLIMARVLAILAFIMMTVAAANRMAQERHRAMTKTGLEVLTTGVVSAAAQALAQDAPTYRGFETTLEECRADRDCTKGSCFESYQGYSTDGEWIWMKRECKPADNRCLCWFPTGA